MGKKLFVWTTAVMIIFGLVLLTSCAKPKVKPDPSEVVQLEKDMVSAEARARAEAEDLEEEALRLEMAQARQAFVSEDINFAFDKSVLTATAQEILKLKAGWMRDNPGAHVIIEGHCDARGTAEYNLALGDRRARSAKKFLVDLGLAASRLTTISYGEERPLDPRSNEEAWAKNRRASFVIR